MTDVTEPNTTETEIGNEGGAAPAAQAAPSDFLSQLPEEMRGDKTFAKLKGKGVEDFAKAYKHAVEKIGGNTVKIPGEGATDADWQEYREKMGIPDTVEGYELNAPDEIPEGLQIDEDSQKWFREVSQKLHLTKGQAGKLYKEYLALQGSRYQTAQQQQQEAQARAVQEVEADLKREFGLAYEDRIEAAYGVLNKLEAPAELEQGIKSLPPQERAAFTKLLAKVAREFEDDTVIGGSRRTGKLTPAEARAEIDKINSDEDQAHLNADHPSHKQVRARLLELRTLAAGA